MTLIDEIDAYVATSLCPVAVRLLRECREALLAADEMRGIIHHHWPQDALREGKLQREANRFRAAFYGEGKP